MGFRQTTPATGWKTRTRSALLTGKICNALLQLTRSLNLPWGGTAFPGRVALKMDRNIVAALRSRYQRFILVTGTNGKTSTTALLVRLLKSAEPELEVVSNPEGANMVPGLLTALLKAEPVWLAKPRAKGKERSRIAVLEVDEGSLLPLSRLLKKVDMVVVTNLFPDQLDRYGSVTALSQRMKRALAAWPHATLLLNADDPTVASFGHGRPKTHYFTVETADNDPDFSDRDFGEICLCPLCSNRLRFSSRRYAHLGHYACPACGFSRPQGAVLAYPLPDNEEPGSKFLVRTPTQEAEFSSPLRGLYNVYNIMSALTATLVLRPETKLAALTPVVAAFQAPAGRTEQFIWPERGKHGTLVLVKNPAGFNQALTVLADTATESATDTTLVVAINDLPADGRDISWLWDTYIDAIPKSIAVICSGRRAKDVALCFKYHGLPLDKITVVPEIKQAVLAALAAPALNIVMLSNYTALAPLRQALVKQGGTSHVT